MFLTELIYQNTNILLNINQYFLAEAELNISGIKNILLQIIGLVTLVSAIGVLLRAHRRDQSGALMAIGVLLIGALIIGLAKGNNMELVGNWLVHLIFNI